MPGLRECAMSWIAQPLHIYWTSLLCNLLLAVEGWMDFTDMAWAFYIDVGDNFHILFLQISHTFFNFISGHYFLLFIIFPIEACHTVTDSQSPHVLYLLNKLLNFLYFDCIIFRLKFPVDSTFFSGFLDENLGTAKFWVKISPIIDSVHPWLSMSKPGCYLGFVAQTQLSRQRE